MLIPQFGPYHLSDNELSVQSVEHPFRQHHLNEKFKLISMSKSPRLLCYLHNIQGEEITGCKNIPLSCNRLISMLITMTVPVRPIPALTMKKENLKPSCCL